VLVLLLGNWRGGLIVASTIPLSLLFAFILMNVFDVWANLMSLGAIDFGIIVDGAVIIVEGTVFVLRDKYLRNKNIEQSERDKTAVESSSKMMRSAFFGQLIILIVFIPILALEGVEGKMFRPMALTFMFAMIGVIILCLTYVPMMSALFIRVGGKEIKWGDRFIRWLESVYRSILKPTIHKPVLVIGTAGLLLVGGVFTFLRLGGEFIPQLDEGDIAFHIILKPGSNLNEMLEASTKVEKVILRKFPEVEKVVSRIGVSEVATDLMPMDMADGFIILKPQSEWVSANSKSELIDKIKTEIEKLPGYTYEFTQPIEMRFNELMTGVREDIAIKVFGEDLKVLAEKANEISRLISDIEGIGDLRVEATTGLPQITVRYNRNKLASYGLSINDVNRLIETAFGGGTAGVIFEGEKRFDLVVRLAPEARTRIEDVRDLYVDLSNGERIPLDEVAEITFEEGPMQISRDNTNRRTYVGVNVRGRDIQSLVEEISDRLDRRLDLPPGYYLRYGGTFENFERATKRLRLLVPVALGLIFILIFFALRSLKETAMIYISIPLAAIGGIFSLWLRDMPFSISAGVGFIVLFGVAVLNGLVLISGWNELKEEGVTNLDERILQGAKRRVRPILLTALTDILGFMPMALSTSAGAEVQRPLATVVIGGMVSATLLTLIVLPVLYRLLERSKTSATRIATVALLLGLGLSAKAQTVEDPVPLNLEDALHRAKERYPSLKAASMEVENRNALKKTAWNLGNTGLFTAGEEIDDREGVYTIIGIQQQNIDLFSVPAKAKLRKQDVYLAEARRDLTEAQLTLEVKSAYAEVFAAKKLHELYTVLDTSFADFERAAQVRYDTEATSKLEFLAATNQRRQVAIRRERALRDYRIALRKFNLWMMSDTLFTATTAFSPIPLPETELIPPLSEHPAVQVANQRVALAEQLVDAKAAGFLPKLNLQYGVQEIQGETGFYQYQAGINFPLLFFNQQGQVQSAKIERMIAEENRRQISAEIRTDYYTAIESYYKWRDAWYYYRDEVLPLTEEQRRGTTLAYEEGNIDYVNFLQNMKSVMELEIEAWEAFRNYSLRLYEVEYFILNNSVK
jgi:cobalt-zinc-cadmium resistance protein CzcA